MDVVFNFLPWCNFDMGTVDRVCLWAVFSLLVGAKQSHNDGIWMQSLLLLSNGMSGGYCLDEINICCIVLSLII